jgi:hypothetical protein
MSDLTQILCGVQFKWYPIDSETSIMRVVNGWVLRTMVKTLDGIGIEQTFLPDTRK